MPRLPHHSARNQGLPASTAFDLRCDVREGMLTFIKREMPKAIVRYRGEMTRGESKAIVA